METKIKERCIYCGGDIYYHGGEQLVKCEWCGHTLAVVKFESELAKMNAALEEGEAAKKALNNAEQERDRAKAKLEKAISALDGIHMSQRNANKALTRIAVDFSKNKEEQREMKTLLSAVRGQVNEEGNLLSKLLEVVSHGQQDGKEKLDTLRLLSEGVLNNQNNMLAAMAILPQLSEKLDMNTQQQNQLAGTFMTWFQNIRQGDVKRLMAIAESSRALSDRQKVFEEKFDLLQQSAMDIQSKVDGLHQEYNRDKLEKIRSLYHQAENEQKDREFDKAYETYKKVLAEGHEAARDAEVYWRMLMCHYGLTYKKNAEGKMIPIILIPDLGDPDQMSLRKELRSCLIPQDTEIKKYYEEQLSEIDEILESYRHLRLETEYDVFISVKQTDDSGRYTADSDKASDLFDFLTSRGVNVFNSRRTLRAGEIYEPRIIAALMSARVMIVVGSSAENMNSEWVRNEWSRYTWLQRRENDSKKKLLCYLTGDMDPYRIPKGLNPDRQAIRDGINAQEDVLTALKDIIPSGRDTIKTTTGKARVSGNTATTVTKESLEDVLSQMTVWLTLNEYEKVLNKYEQIKAEPPYLYEPHLHLYALCAEKKVDEIKELTSLNIDLEKEKLFKLAMKLCKDSNKKGFLQKMLEENKRQKAESPKKETSRVVDKSEPKKDDVEGWFQMGVDALRRKEYTEAIKWYRKAAEHGHADAQVDLGVIFENGRGVKQDKKQAAMWYRKAAEQGNSRGQNNLGGLYFDGSGVEQDKRQAVYWYRKATEQGHRTSQYNLGYCYENGDGVNQDKKQAVMWYRKAAEQGHLRAQYRLGSCYFYGEGVEQDKKQAVMWYRKAAEQGHALAQYNLGYCYENGEGIGRDKNQAIDWYQKAADQGNESAKQALTKCTREQKVTIIRGKE